MVYSNGTATVTYTTTAPYFLTEPHLYVGSAILPSDNGEFTVAPGQYGNVNEYDYPYPTTKTYTVSGLTGPVYVVAHATVGGF